MFTNLQIRGVSMHTIHAKQNTTTPARAEESNHAITLSAEALSQLSSRIVDALGDESDAIEMIKDVSESDETLNCISRLFNNPNDQIIKTESFKITELLADAHSSASIPGGPVFVLRGTTSADNVPFIAVIKAEFTNALFHGENDITVINKIFLTDKQTLYKVGFAYLADTNLADNEKYLHDNFNFLIFDNNTSFSSQNPRAQYFYKKFLGLTYRETDAILTKKFYQESKKFITTRVTDKEDAFNLVTNLYSYLSSSARQTLKTSNFARDILPEDLRAEYRREMLSRGIPTTQFHLDPQEIKRDLGTRVVAFANGQKVKIPSMLVVDNDTVTFDPDENITTIKFRGPPMEL